MLIPDAKKSNKNTSSRNYETRRKKFITLSIIKCLGKKKQRKEMKEKEEKKLSHSTTNVVNFLNINSHYQLIYLKYF